MTAGLGDLLVAGTCLEYGMQSGPLDDDLAPAPDTAYGLAKDTLRRGLLLLLQRETAFRFTWARLFYIYGEGQAPNSLYPLLRRAALAGERQFPMSGGEPLRDYLPVTEVARYLSTLGASNPDAGTVNVCSGAPVSVRTLVERWIAENGWPIAPALGRYPYPDYEPLAFWGTARKLHHLLGRPAAAGPSVPTAQG